MAYGEIVNFIARGASTKQVADYEMSPRSKEFVAGMIQKKMTIGLTPEESSDLDYYVQIEQLMLLAKERARALYMSQV